MAEQLNKHKLLTANHKGRVWNARAELDHPRASGQSHELKTLLPLQCALIWNRFAQVSAACASHLSVLGWAAFQHFKLKLALEPEQAGQELKPLLPLELALPAVTLYLLFSFSTECWVPSFSCQHPFSGCLNQLQYFFLFFPSVWSFLWVLPEVCARMTLLKIVCRVMLGREVP